METIEQKIKDVCYDSIKYGHSETDVSNKITRKVLEIIEEENSKILMFESCRKALRAETERRVRLELLLTELVNDEMSDFSKDVFLKMQQYVNDYQVTTKRA